MSICRWKSCTFWSVKIGTRKIVLVFPCEYEYELFLIRASVLSIKVEVNFWMKMKIQNIRKWKKEWASSHTPRSNIAWEGCIQWMAIPSSKDGQSDKKGDINCSSKGSNQHFLYKCISTHNVLHNYKVSRNSVERFQWSCADQLFQ